MIIVERSRLENISSLQKMTPLCIIVIDWSFRRNHDLNSQVRIRLRYSWQQMIADLSSLNYNPNATVQSPGKTIFWWSRAWSLRSSPPASELGHFGCRRDVPSPKTLVNVTPAVSLSSKYLGFHVCIKGILYTQILIYIKCNEQILLRGLAYFWYKYENHLTVCCKPSHSIQSGLRPVVLVKVKAQPVLPSLDFTHQLLQP